MFCVKCKTIYPFLVFRVSDDLLKGVKLREFELERTFYLHGSEMHDNLR